jgi:hypothetical protein
MRRIDRERRQHRKHAAEEIFLKPLAVGLGDVRGLDDNNADVFNLGAKLAPAPQLLARQQRDALGDLRQLLGGRQAVRSAP